MTFLAGTLVGVWAGLLIGWVACALVRHGDLPRDRYYPGSYIPEPFTYSRRGSGPAAPEGLFTEPPRLVLYDQDGEENRDDVTRYHRPSA